MRDPAELLSGYFDDSLEEGERAELRAWLAAEPERLRQFVRESIIHSRLRDVLVQHDMRGLVFDDAFGDTVDPKHIASLLDEEEAAAERRALEAAEQARREALAAARRAELLDRKLMRIDEPRPSQKLTYVSFAVAATLLIMIGRWTGRALAPAPAPKADAIVEKSPAPAEPPIIAVVTGAFDAQLHRNGVAIVTRAKLSPGVLEVERGVAEVRFAAGAKIVVEGPAKLELMTGERAKLISGRVVAYVPQEALGFTLHAEGASFVDLGTEFGLEVDADNQAMIHVLDGEVALVSGRKEEASSRTLKRGVANVVSVDGSIRDIPFDEARFLRRVPASAFDLAVLKSRPLAFWRLDQTEPNAKITSEGRLAISTFISGGIASADNRAPTDTAGGPARAALFEGEHEGIDIAADAALGLVTDRTCEALVRAVGSPSGPKRIFSTFDRPRSGLAIGLVDSGWYKLPGDELKFQLTLYGVYDCISTTSIPIDEWVYLAASIDSRGTPTLYVNGVAADRRFRPIAAAAPSQTNDGESAAWTADSPTPVGLTTTGMARIGRNPIGADGQITPERWQGQISHVAVYDRVLDGEEISRHFDATRIPFTDHQGQRP